MVLAGATAVAAAPQPGSQRDDPVGPFTEAVITGTGNGSAVDGYDAPAGFDPLDGYPAGIPAGSTHDPVAFAGTIRIQDPGSGQTALTYCINLSVDTETGVHYDFTDWAHSGVPNLGYVEYILQHYYPVTNAPAGAANNNQRAAAVQSAIWFFTDRLVLATDDPVRALTAGVVADALANGPSAEPQRPQLSVTPDSLDAPSTGDIVGPFTVSGNGPGTLTTNGVDVFTDAQGTDQLQDGATVQPGTRLWARSASASAPHDFVLERTATYLVGTALVYDGTNPGLDAAQALVLAQEARFTARAGAELNVVPSGNVRVTKHITGEGAGEQGRVVVDLDCRVPGEDPVRHTVTVPAGAAAGDHSRTVTGIPAGSVCEVTESANGDNDRVDLSTDPVIDPATVTVVADETQDVSVTDDYVLARGGIKIVKKIAGKAAGKQGAVTIALDCDDPENAFDRTFTVPAGTAAGTYPQAVVDGIPAGTRCTVRETATGANDDAVLTSVVIDPETTTVRDGVVGTVSVTDTYGKPDHTCYGYGQSGKYTEYGTCDRKAA